MSNTNIKLDGQKVTFLSLQSFVGFLPNDLHCWNWGQAAADSLLRTTPYSGQLLMSISCLFQLCKQQHMFLIVSLHT